MHAMHPYGQEQLLHEYARMTAIDMLGKKYEMHTCDTAGCWYTDSDNTALVSECVAFCSDHC